MVVLDLMPGWLTLERRTLAAGSAEGGLCGSRVVFSACLYIGMCECVCVCLCGGGGKTTRIFSVSGMISARFSR